MQTNSVGWFEIYVENMDRAQTFYEGVFQKKLDKMETPDSVQDLQMVGFPGNMETYGANGALVQMKEYGPSPSGTIVYFSCEDCSNESSRVEDLGGKIVKPKFSIGKYGNIALVQDSEGNMIGLHSMK